MNRVDIHRLFHPNTNILLTAMLNESFFKTDHILGLKTNLYIFRKCKTTPCILSDQVISKWVSSDDKTVWSKALTTE